MCRLIHTVPAAAVATWEEHGWYRLPGVPEIEVAGIGGYVPLAYTLAPDTPVTDVVGMYLRAAMYFGGQAG
ncbi:hypothetical protein P7L75_01370 (plasmid) [Tistrella mobilis]|uniref:hypothetical protein n=1 Tax=Tistrella mobilis TaxID=171437 RepID=UPI003557C23C